MSLPRLLTPGLCAVAVGVLPHQIVRLCDRGMIPQQRAGRLRVIESKDLELVRRACEAAGYLRTPDPLDLGAFSLEDRVEGRGELGVVAEQQEPGRQPPPGHPHRG